MIPASRRDVLLDTGPIVAALDAADQWHDACAAAMLDLIDRCVTTEAVVTEACHLVGRGRGRGQSARVIDFLCDAEVPVLALDLPALRHAAGLMHRYAKVPMDFADAGLVSLADALELASVFTIDRRGFRAYRTRGSIAFQLYP